MSLFLRATSLPVTLNNYHTLPSQNTSYIYIIRIITIININQPREPSPFHASISRCFSEIYNYVMFLVMFVCGWKNNDRWSHVSRTLLSNCISSVLFSIKYNLPNGNLSLIIPEHEYNRFIWEGKKRTLRLKLVKLTNRNIMIFFTERKHITFSRRKEPTNTLRPIVSYNQ